MPFILAIEPDARQAARVAALAPSQLDADILVVGSVEEALATLDTARPDLVLTPLLLSAKDDTALTARLRELDDDGVELQTLVIPVLADAGSQSPVVVKNAGLLTKLRKPRTAPVGTGACAPEVFAAQIREYLSRMAAERHDREEIGRGTQWPAPHAVASAPMLGELLTVPDVTQAAHDWASIVDDDTSGWSALEQSPQASEPIAATIVEPVSFDIRLQSDPGPAEAGRYDRTSDSPAHAGHDDEGTTTPITAGHDDWPAIDPLPQQVDMPPIIDVEPIAANSSDEPLPGGEWEDLESFLEDLGLDEAHVAIAIAAADNIEAMEPSVVELPPPDELWAALGATPQQQAPPIEGPTLRPRRKAADVKPLKPVKPARSISAQARPAAARPRKPKAAKRPMQDEWGLYDPEQCGIAALLERLDEITRTDAEEKERDGRSAIMRR